MISDVAVSFVVQPAERGARFRYESESRGVQVLYGEGDSGSSLRGRIFPVVEVTGLCKGDTYDLIVFPVTESYPYFHHPHCLEIKSGQGADSSEGFIIYRNKQYKQSQIRLKEIGVRVTKKDQFSAALTKRQDAMQSCYHIARNTQGSEFEVDSKVDISRIRLEVMVFVTRRGQRFTCGPVRSNVVHNQKELSLDIIRLSHPAVSTKGEEILVVAQSHVKKGDVYVVLYDDNDKPFVEISPLAIDHKVVLFLKVPKFPHDILTPKTGSICLASKEKGVIRHGNKIPIIFSPTQTTEEVVERKRKKPLSPIERRGFGVEDFSLTMPPPAQPIRSFAGPTPIHPQFPANVTAAPNTRFDNTTRQQPGFSQPTTFQAAPHRALPAYVEPVPPGTGVHVAWDQPSYTSTGHYQQPQYTDLAPVQEDPSYTTLTNKATEHEAPDDDDDGINRPKDVEDLVLSQSKTTTLTGDNTADNYSHYMYYNVPRTAIPANGNVGVNSQGGFSDIPVNLAPDLDDLLHDGSPGLLQTNDQNPFQ